MVGPAFTTLRDIGDDFNLVFATAAHTSAKIREELKGVDYEQWAKLPEERERTEVVTRENSKTKTRKVVEGFELKTSSSSITSPLAMRRITRSDTASGCNLSNQR